MLSKMRSASVRSCFENHTGIDLNDLFSLSAEGIVIDYQAMDVLRVSVNATTAAELLLSLDAIYSDPPVPTARGVLQVAPHIYDVEGNYGAVQLIGAPPPRSGANYRDVLDVLLYAHAASSVDPLYVALCCVRDSYGMPYVTLVRALGFHWVLSPLIEAGILKLVLPAVSGSPSMPDLLDLIDLHKESRDFRYVLVRAIPELAQLTTDLHARPRTADLVGPESQTGRANRIRGQALDAAVSASVFGGGDLLTLDRDLKRFGREPSLSQGSTPWFPTHQHFRLVELMESFSGIVPSAQELVRRLDSEIILKASVFSTTSVSAMDLRSLRLNDEVLERWRSLLSSALTSLSEEDELRMTQAQRGFAAEAERLRAELGGSWTKLRRQAITSFSVASLGLIAGAAVGGGWGALAGGLTGAGVRVPVQAALDVLGSKKERDAKRSARTICLIFSSGYQE